MNIKISDIRLLSAAALSTVAMLTACNDIQESNRYRELPAAEVKRTVLLEEFTGQLCVNCPIAHEIINELKAQYGDRLITVGIHSGGDAFSIAEGDPIWTGYQGLRIPEGETYLSNAGFKSGMGLPIGQVNRTSGLIDRDEWSKFIYNEISRDSEIEITLDAALVGDNPQAPENIGINVGLRSVADNDVKLQVWITESGIKTIQLLPDGNAKDDYEHSHVLRATVNGINGEAISLVGNETAVVSYTCPVKAVWNPEKLSVVAFAYNGSGVLQAAETHVSDDSDQENESETNN